MKGKVRVKSEDENVQACIAYINRNYTYGELITTEVLKKLSGFYRTKVSIPPGIDGDEAERYMENAIQERELNYMAFKSRIKSCMLDDHKKAMKNEFGKGYVIVLPQEQAEFAHEKIVSRIRGSIKKASDIVNNTDKDKLNKSQLHFHTLRMDIINGMIKSISKAVRKSERFFAELKEQEHNRVQSPTMESLRGARNGKEAN